LPEVNVTDVATDVEGITIGYDVAALKPDMTATDEIIACALLKTGEVCIAKQILGFETTGTVFLKFKDPEDVVVVCCYVFVRSGDGKKTSNSVFVEVNS